MNSESTTTGLFEKAVSDRPDGFPGNSHPKSTDAQHYHTYLQTLKNTCIPLYKEVAQASLAKDIEDLIAEIANLSNSKSLNMDLLTKTLFEKIRYLNSHGPEHVQLVDKRACELLIEMKIVLEAYELYFLVAAIWVHDVGMIYGRDGHEKSLKNVVSSLGDTIGDEQERRTIIAIAGVHGGHVENQPDNKDTISTIRSSSPVSSKRVRLQLLAALVRLADELAEDKSRATKIPSYLKTSEDSATRASEVFHAYSSCLDSCIINGSDRTIELEFLLNVDDVIRDYHKGSKKVYLLDEIYDRTTKVFNELTYCNRFFVDALQGGATLLDAVKIDIKIYDNSDDIAPIFLMAYTLRGSGYPTYDSSSLLTHCPEITKAMKDLADTIPDARAQDALKQGPNGKCLAEIFAVKRAASITPKPRKTLTERFQTIFRKEEA
ncbi:MAG: hypothetical protein KF836_07835 [Fimbriimonadaceae bacterium]|nr:hypothetical protein [Fimbriimonadaceae bacterium]